MNGFKIWLPSTKLIGTAYMQTLVTGSNLTAVYLQGTLLADTVQADATALSLLAIGLRLLHSLRQL